MVKEFHLYCGNTYPEDCLHTLSEIERVYGKADIHTTQVSALSTALFYEGYRIFVHPVKGPVFEITLGDCANTNREIREGHNLERLLIAGEFDTDDTIVYGNLKEDDNG